MRMRKNLLAALLAGLLALAGAACADEGGEGGGGETPALGTEAVTPPAGGATDGGATPTPTGT